MYRIRKKRNRQSQQDPAFPMQVTRAFLFSLRYAHQWQQLLLETYRTMPAEWQPKYRTYMELQIKPSFDEVIQLIEGARQQGFVNADEAATLNAGKPIEFVFSGSSPELPSLSDHQGAD